VAAGSELCAESWLGSCSRTQRRQYAEEACIQFKREVEKKQTGKETGPREITCLKQYKSQIPVIEQAIETATIILGSDISRGYCPEMICADFLAGANRENGNPKILLSSITRFFRFLPSGATASILWKPQRENIMSPINPNPRWQVDPELYEQP
jgi:hypothetical protein